MFKRTLIIKFILLIGLLSLASGNSNRKVDWLQYNTKHFKILFHKEIQVQADTAVQFLEYAYKKIKSELGLFRFNSVKITVILTGVPENFNGSAIPLGHEIEIFTKPIGFLNGDHINSFKRVLAHELTHQLTFLEVRNFLGIYGEMYKSAYLPMWFVEGVAQFAAETWDVKRNMFLTYGLKNSALEPYVHLSTFMKEDVISSRLVYEQGHHFIRFLAQKHGKKIIGKILRMYTVFPVLAEFNLLLSPLNHSLLINFLQPPFESAILKSTGRHINFHLEQYQDYLSTTYRQEFNPLKNKLKEIPDDFDIVFQAKFKDKNTIFFTAQENWRVSKIDLYKINENKIKKYKNQVASVFDVSENGEWILYVKKYLDPDGLRFTKLILKNLVTADENVIAISASSPEFLNDSTFSFVKYIKGLTSVYIGSVNSDIKPKKVIQDNEYLDIYGLSSSRNGFLFTGVDEKGLTGIYEFNKKNKEVIKVIKDTCFIENPIEISDSIIIVNQRKNGTLTVQEYNRNSKIFSPRVEIKQGVYGMHNSGNGIVSAASYDKVKAKQSAWAISLYDVSHAKTIDSDYSNIDSISQQKYLFAENNEIDISEDLLKIPEKKTYISLPRILLLFPFLGYTAGNFSAGISANMADPLHYHQFSGGVGLFNTEQTQYDIQYMWNYFPIVPSFQWNNNTDLLMDSTINGDSTYSHYLVFENRIGSLHMNNMLSLPFPHSVFWEFNYKYQRLWTETTEDGGGPPKRVRKRKWITGSKYIWNLGYSHIEPSSFIKVHPLYLKYVFLNMEFDHDSYSPGFRYHGETRVTHPLNKWGLTYTLFMDHLFRDVQFRAINFRDKEGQIISSFYNEYLYGASSIYYMGLDFPLIKTLITKWPLINYFGIGTFITYFNSDVRFSQLEVFNKNLDLVGKGELFLGLKANALMFLIGRIPINIEGYFIKSFEVNKQSFGWNLNLATGDLGKIMDFSQRKRISRNSTYFKNLKQELRYLSSN